MAQRSGGENREAAAEGVAPAEAFGVLSNETRVDVLRALARLEGPVSYARLRRAVAYGGSGNFNYHLDRLVGPFVEKSDEGYALRRAGEAVARLVVAGTLTERAAVPDRTGDARCGVCGGRLTLRDDGGAVRLRCRDCATAGEGGPAAVRCERATVGLADREAAAEAAQVLHGAHLATLLSGVCPDCGGPTTLDHEPREDRDRPSEGPPGSDGAAVRAHAACERCGFEKRFPPRVAALYDPAVVAWLHERGVDLSLPVRSLSGDAARVVREMEASVRDADPHRFRVTVSAGGERLRVDLDETLRVTTVERRPDGTE
jgi:hypothetical protein